MLVLSRHRDESIYMELEDGRLIKLMPVDIRGDKVRLGIEAPDTIKIHREEIWEQIVEERTASASPAA
ncbi:carbon storage regulator [Planctomicrobium sp. SH661]|uniref:carbon storage regulator n=1 Tax=Planctomicrobium sp. SH661 TaxID=3448124 RepID=UPI003F5C3F4D